MVMDAWRASGKYDVVGLARSEDEYADVVADIGDLDALTEAFQDADAVVHLAGSAAVDSSWEDVLENNIIGLRNVFEAARLAGVTRVVFASSNHAVGTFETANAPQIWEIDDPRQIDHTSEIMPDSYYGVSKAYGEAMARYYVDHHGLQAVCLRIGGCTGTESPNAPENLWKPERDEAPGIRTERARTRALAITRASFGISSTPARYWVITRKIPRRGNCSPVRNSGSAWAWIDHTLTSTPSGLGPGMARMSTSSRSFTGM
jgi:nucleoside-diphosphate-sugar epimerase